MNEEPEQPQRIRAWIVSVRRGEAPALFKKLMDGNAPAEGSFLVLRGEMVFGMDHLRSALFHADKAIREHRNSSDSLAMETLLYASGERQLANAIKKMSVSEDTTEVVVALLSDSSLEPDHAWQPLKDGAEKEDLITALKRFGISDEEIRTVTMGRAADLVLERVAMVDVLKK